MSGQKRRKRWNRGWLPIHPLHDDLLDSPVGATKPSPSPQLLRTPISDYRTSRIDWRRPILGGQFETTLEGTVGIVKGTVSYSMELLGYRCSVDLCFPDATISRTWIVHDWDLHNDTNLHKTFTAKIQEAYNEYKGKPYPLLGEVVN